MGQVLLGPHTSTSYQYLRCQYFSFATLELAPPTAKVEHDSFKERAQHGIRSTKGKKDKKDKKEKKERKSSVKGTIVGVSEMDSRAAGPPSSTI